MHGAPVETVPPLSQVLACTDFSLPARQAVERAARIARAQDAALHLLHTVPGGALDELTSWLGVGSAVPQQLVDHARAELQKLATDLHRAPGGDSHALSAAGATAAAAASSTRPAVAAGHWAVRCHVETGSVTQQARRCAEVLQADLVVLAARGAGALRRLVLGTTSDRLLRLLHAPVLVVRNPAAAPYRRVVVAVDFSPWSALAVQTARRVAPGVPLVLLNITSVPFEDKLRFAGVPQDTIAHHGRQARAEALQRLHALAHDLGLQTSAWSPRVVEGEAWQRIVQAEAQEQADLLVLGKQGRTAAEDLLLGSVTRHVLAEGSADLLVCTDRPVGRPAPP